jgi:hypothetical protein
MPVFKDAAKLQRYLKVALDAVQAETLISTQAKLGSAAVSPIDTGRFRSSWFASEGSASSEVAPEGTNSPQTDAASLKVDADKTYHLTNSLPYAQKLAIEGRVSPLKDKSPNWFRDFRTVEIPRLQRAASLAVKRQFQL